VDVPGEKDAPKTIKVLAKASRGRYNSKLCTNGSYLHRQPEDIC